MSDVEDLKEPAAPKAAPESAPAATTQTETAPGSAPPDAAPQGSQKEPPQERSFDEDFPDRSFDEDFPDREPKSTDPLVRALTNHQTDPSYEGAPLSFDKDQWRAYLNTAPLGRAISAFGDAFTGPGITDELLKYGFAEEEMHGLQNSYAQAIVRPILRGSRLLATGFLAAPVALFDAGTRLLKGTEDALSEAGLREVAQALDMETTFGHIIPGGAVHAVPLKAPKAAVRTAQEIAESSRLKARTPEEIAEATAPSPKAQVAENWGRARLATLDAKAEGRAAVKATDETGTPAAIPEQAPELLTDQEKLERQWLRLDPHGDDILRAYPNLGPYLTRERNLPEFIARARANAIIAEGEEGYFGTRPPTEADLAARRAAAADIDHTDFAKADEAKLDPPKVTPVDRVARQIDPVLFREWDELSAVRENLSRWMRELPEKTRANIEANPPAALRDIDAEISKLQKKMDNAGNRRRAEFEEAMQAIHDRRDDLLADLVRSHPDMAQVRSQLQKTDYRMRDLAPEVSNVYRQARDVVPEEVPEAAGAPDSASPAQEPALGASEGAPEGEMAATEPPGVEPVRAESQPSTAAPGTPEFVAEAVPREASSPAQIKFITDDVVKKLVGVGRPLEEAQAAAAVVAARYEARAKWLGGKAGSAEELYRKDFPTIRVGQSREPRRRVAPAARAREFAQERLRAVTETPEFKAWFDGSKVVDADGQPLVLFHGTNQTGLNKFNEHTFFGDAATAGEYANDHGRGRGDTVYPVFLSIKNPAKDADIYAAAEALGIETEGPGALPAFEYVSPNLSGYGNGEVVAELKRRGFDGTVVQDFPPDGDRMVTSYSIFDPAQAKSPFNRGDFSRNDARILFQGADEQAGAPAPLWQTKKGSITFAPRDGAAVIKLFKDADASTFMHEMGHKFLEELLQDAAHPAAPAQLKADAATALKYLEAESGKPVPTKGHEKWARGWERYLMEGRAPTKALADVFAKFAKWLTDLYGMVAKLRSPINDDIRDVFDRLLTNSPERATITPELPLESGLADAHEGLMRTARGATESLDHAHRMAGETAEEARAKAAEIINELRLRRGESGGAAGSGEPQRPGSGSGGAAPGDVAGADGNVPQPGEVVPGGGGAAAQGSFPDKPAPGVKPAAGPKALYERVPKRPPSLADWIKAKGGVQDHNGEVSALGGKRKPGMIKAEGKKIDDVIVDAWDSGFFPEWSERPTVREFLDKLEDDLRGNHQWSEHNADEVAEYQAKIAHNADVDQIANELAIETKGLTYGEFWDKVAERKSEADQARLIAEKSESHAESLAEADRAAKEFLESRGDAWEPDAVAGGAGRTLEDLENERRSEESARGLVSGPSDGGGFEPARRNPGPVQDGGGSGGPGAVDAGGPGAAGAAPDVAPAVGATEQAVPGAQSPAAAAGEAGSAGGQGAKNVSDAGGQRAGSADAIENREPHLVDKAGNIRLDNLNSTESVNAVLRDFADRNGQFMEARRGVVTDEEVLAYARAMGVEAQEVNIEKLRAMSVDDGIPLAARIQGGRDMLIQSAEAVFEAMKGEDEIAYAEAAARHLRIQETLSGVTAEWGRAGRAFRKNAEQAQKAQQLSIFLEENTGRTLNQIQAEMKLGGSLKDKPQVSKFLRDARVATNTDKVLEVWINALLSGPQTHMANITSNALVSVMTVAETGAAAGIGQVRHLITGTQDRVFFGEAIEQLFALRQGTTEGLSAALEILKNEKLIDSLGLLERPRQGAIGGVAGAIVRAPGRAMGAEDAVFKAIAYRQKINQLAYRTARAEGLEGDALARRVSSLKNTPTASMMQEGVDFSRYQTFNRDLGDIGRKLQSFVGSHPGLKFIAPFIRTPTNVFKYSMERTPFALGSMVSGRIGAEVRAKLMGERGAVARDEQLARIAVGSSIMVAGYFLAASGDITGGGPTNPAERAAWIRRGNRPYSFRVGGEWHNYGRFEPLATLLGVPADAWEIRHVATTKENADWGKMAAASIVTNLSNKASLRGPGMFFQFMTSPDRSLESYVKQQTGSFIPGVMAQAARAADPYERETKGWLDNIKARVPILRESVKPRLDVWGREIANENAGVLGFVNPSQSSAINNDPIEREMDRLGFYPAKLDDKIRGVKLTPDQYEDYQKIAGRLARVKMQTLMAQPGWNQQSLQDRRKWAVEVFNHPTHGAREIARQTIIAKSMGGANDIGKKATENKAAVLRDLQSRAASRPE